MTLPVIDFGAIAATAKEALANYGSPVTFYEGTATSGRTIRAVIYRDQAAEFLMGDIDSRPALAIINPDDFIAPHRMVQKFDRLKIEIGGFTRTYTVDAPPAPILAADKLPLILLQLKAN